jgi:hypothetical protein
VRLDLRPARRNAGRPAEKDAPGFLQFVRGRPCIFADQGGCEGKRQAAHLDFAGGKGVGTKVADRYSVPMCGRHHRIQHDKGWETFMRMTGCTREQLMLAAARLWNSWSGRRAWEAKQGECA